MKGFAVASILGFAAIGSAVVIDDFTTGTFSYSKNVGAVGANKAGTMLGDSRWVISTIALNPATIAPLTVTVDGGVADFSAGTLIQHVTDVRYGYSLTNTLEDMNADLTGGKNQLKISFLSNERDLNLVVQLRQTTETGAKWAAFGGTVGANADAFDYYVPFSAFGTFDMSNVDQLIIRFKNVPSGDFALSGVEIEAVPEPATMVGLGLGLAFLARRRRKA